MNACVCVSLRLCLLQNRQKRKSNRVSLFHGETLLIISDSGAPSPDIDNRLPTHFSFCFFSQMTPTAISYMDSPTQNKMLQKKKTPNKLIKIKLEKKYIVINIILLSHKIIMTSFLFYINQNLLPY